VTVATISALLIVQLLAPPLHGLSAVLTATDAIPHPQSALPTPEFSPSNATSGAFSQKAGGATTSARIELKFPADG
jgi:hypothetical protein